MIAPADGAIAHRVPEAELVRLLGLPVGAEAGAEAGRARSWLAAHGTPLAVARRVDLGEVTPPTLRLASGERWVAPGLAERLVAADAHALIAIAVSAGPEVDREVSAAWAARPDRAWALDRLGAAVAEQLLAETGIALCQALEPCGESVVAPLSPGCGSWSLAGQRALFALLADPVAGRLVCLDSGGLQPKNALLAAAGVTRRAVAWEADPAVRACRTCRYTGCAFRRR